MKLANQKIQKISQLFWLFLIAHTILWTITPVFIRHALSDDFIEAVTWGQQFVWSYDENPWLPGSLAHLGILIGGTSGIGIYFIQALFIALGFYAVWRLMCKCSNPIYALMAVMMYEACACYSVDLQIYNDNYILMGLLPLASLFFYRALKTDFLSDWLIGATLTALAVMGKYDAVLFAFSIFCYLMIHKKRLHYLTSYKTWGALLLFILILLPNFIWLKQHDFLTLSYAFYERAAFQNTPWMTQAKNNLIFTWLTIIGFLPALLLLLFSYTRKSTIQIKKTGSHDDLTFLFWASFGPILLLIILGFGLGLTLHREWGNTFIGLWSSFIILRVHPSVSMQSVKRFIIVTLILLFFWPIAYLIVSYQRDTGTFPGQEMATLATKTWHDHFHTKLWYVAGDRYTAGYVGLHSIDHPSVWMEWNSTASTWINEKNLRCHGALFIQDSGHTRLHLFSGLSFPKKIRQQFPTLIVLKPKSLSWYRNYKHRPDVQILMGLLPPDPTQCTE